MFGKKETTTSFSAGTTTLVSKNTEVVGDINFSGNLMVEGTVKGNMYSVDGADAHARILESGIIEGEIRVPTIVINGTINGDVYSSKHIELAAKAIINGNVHYELIEMVKGAQVNGNLVYSAKSSVKKAVDSLSAKQDSSEANRVKADLKTITSPAINKA